MAQKTCNEMNNFEKNFNELYELYEEKVKKSINNTRYQCSTLLKAVQNFVVWMYYIIFNQYPIDYNYIDF